MKQLVVGLYMQQLNDLGCDWTDNGLMFLHQDTDILNSSIDAVTKVTDLEAISNVQISAHYIATIPK